jgi:hypothetical protein
MSPFAAHVMAVDRVERRLRAVAAALDAAGIAYAVVGGNAVASWVGSVDPAATRATKDVDVLVRRDDLAGVTAALEAIGFQRQDLRGLTLFVDPAEPSRRSGIHLVWAGERVRPSYLAPAPDVAEAIRDSEGFLVLDLPALVRMKLTSFRDIDRVHVRDLIEVGLVGEQVRGALPEPLRSRLDELAAGEP